VGAVEAIRRKRREAFYNDYIEKVIAEAKKLELAKEDIIAMIERGYDR
jgi:GntR family transcriptional regulator